MIMLRPLYIVFQGYARTQLVDGGSSTLFDKYDLKNVILFSLGCHSAGYDGGSVSPVGRGWSVGGEGEFVQLGREYLHSVPTEKLERETHWSLSSFF